MTQPARQGAVAVARVGGGSPEARCDTAPPHPPAARLINTGARRDRTAPDGTEAPGGAAPGGSGKFILGGHGKFIPGGHGKFIPGGHRGVLPAPGQPGCGTGMQHSRRGRERRCCPARQHAIPISLLRRKGFR